MRVLFVLRKAPIMRATISRLVLVDADRFVDAANSAPSESAASNAVLTHSGSLKRAHQARSCGTGQLQAVGLYLIPGVADGASLEGASPNGAVSRGLGYLPQMRCPPRATTTFRGPLPTLIA